MGLSCSIMAFSPRVPREDIVARASAGPEATAAALEARLPGRFTLADGVGDLTEDFQPHCEHVLAGLWGETLVIAAEQRGGFLSRLLRR